MSMPKDEIQSEVQSAWKNYMESLHKAVSMLDDQIKEASEMADQCTSEWCQATEHVLDDLSNDLFSISEPRWADPEDSKKIKDMKHRIHDIYSIYRGIAQKQGR